MIIYIRYLLVSAQDGFYFTPASTQLFFTMVCILICTSSDDSDYATLGSKKRIQFGTLSVIAGGGWSCLLSILQKLAHQSITSETGDQ